MTRVEAIYQGGVFKPLATVALPENQKVELEIRPLEQKVDVQAWLERTQHLQEELIREHGIFPDSTPDIAEDRLRDVDTVVDSSVVAKWALPEPDSPHARRLVTELQARGERLVILDIALAEVTNSIWKRHHRKLATLEQAHRLLHEISRAPVHVIPSTRLLRPALDIAARYDRAVYDSLFVALAQDLNLPGVTADEPLYRSVHADFPQIILLRDWQP